jgi:hypothetical protein
MDTKVLTPVDLIGSFATALHGVLREAAEQGPLATDMATGRPSCSVKATSKRWPTISALPESGWPCST